MRSRERGFTLVELSIVLVIIGLLIGGILVAQSITSAANVTATVKQFQQLDAGIESFKTKYGYLPSDAPTFGGDGNGFVCRDGDFAANTFSDEIGNFWPRFDSTQFPGPSGGCGNPGCPALTTGPARNVPASKLGSPGAFVVASALSINGSYADFTVNPQNVYAIVSSSVAQAPGVVWTNWYALASPTSAAAVKPVDLLALDQKMDDGSATGGSVKSGSLGGGSVGAVETVNQFPGCNTGSAYNVSNSNTVCIPVVRIGAQTGDPQ